MPDSSRCSRHSLGWTRNTLSLDIKFPNRMRIIRHLTSSRRLDFQIRKANEMTVNDKQTLSKRSIMTADGR